MTEQIQSFKKDCVFVSCLVGIVSETERLQNLSRQYVSFRRSKADGNGFYRGEPAHGPK